MDHDLQAERYAIMANRGEADLYNTSADQDWYNNNHAEWVELMEEWSKEEDCE